MSHDDATPPVLPARRVFWALLALAAALRLLLLALSWNTLRYDDLFAMTQPHPWHTLSGIWASFGRVVPSAIFAVLDKVAPDWPLNAPVLRILASLSIALMLAVAVASWRIAVHWAWRLGAVAVAALHPFWIDVVQFHNNDIATLCGMLGCCGAILALRTPDFGWKQSSALAVSTLAIVGSYQPFIYLPLMWGVLDAALRPERLDKGMKRFVLQAAVVLAAMAVYVVLLRLSHIEGRTGLIGSLGELPGRVQLVAIVLLQTLISIEPIDGPVPRLLGFALLLIFAVAVARRQHASAMAGAKIWPFALMLLCLFGLMTTPLHLVSSDRNFPPRLLTQICLPFAAIVLAFGTWRQGRERMVPVTLAVIVGIGFAVGSATAHLTQQAIWKRDVRIAKYVLAQTTANDAIVDKTSPRLPRRIPYDYAFADATHYFSVFDSLFLVDPTYGTTLAIPFLAYEGGYRVPETAYSEADRAGGAEDRKAADLAACDALTAAPPADPATLGVDPAAFAEFDGIVRVGEREGQPLVCFRPEPPGFKLKT